MVSQSLNNFSYELFLFYLTHHRHPTLILENLSPYITEKAAK